MKQFENMKHFVLKMLLFYICIYILVVIVDYGLSKRLQYNIADFRYATWNEMITGNINADLIIMGSSRAWVQYSPQVLDTILGINSYNVGLTARSFEGQLMRYRVYREYNVKPKYIIQNIDFLSTLGVYNSRNTTASDNTNGMKEQFYPYIYDDRFMQHITDSLSWREMNIPYYRYYGTSQEILLLSLFASKYNNEQYKGYAPQDLVWRNNNLDNYQDSLYFACYDKVLRMFQNYIQEIVEEGISIIFVYSPPHISVTKRILDIDRMYQTFDSIAQIYDIPILDYHYSSIAYDSTFYYNGTHLNARGAELFSTILANDLELLGVVNRKENDMRGASKQ